MTEVPGTRPDTKPVALTPAIAGESLLQRPPLVAFANKVVDPAQTAGVPVMGVTDGTAFTVVAIPALVPETPLATVALTVTTWPFFRLSVVYVALLLAAPALTESTKNS